MNKEPKLGDIRNGRELGFKHERNLMWSACVDCGKRRWVQYVKGKAKSPRCNLCSNRTKEYPSRLGPKSNSWKGGRFVDEQGYVRILVYPDNPYYSMAINTCHRTVAGYIKEHRLVMATYLKRPILRSEQVHHKNGIKDDNRIENLELVGCGEHTVKHNKGYIDGFEQGKIEGKEAEIQERLEIVRKESYNQGFMAGELKSVKEDNLEMTKNIRLLLLTVKNKFGE